MVKAYWLRIVLCGLAGAILGFIIALVTPKQYEAVLQVLMPPPDTIPTRPDSEAGESIADLLNFSAPRNVNTQVEALTSFGVLATAAQAVSQKYGLPVTPGSELYPMDLMDKVNVTAQAQSDLVTLRVRASQADVAREIVAQMYIAFDDNAKRTATEGATRAIASLETQRDKIAAQMTDIDKQTEEARKTAKAPDLSVQIQNMIKESSDLEQSVNSAKQQYAAATARVSALEAEVLKFPKEVQGSSSDGPDPIYVRTQGELKSAQADREQALERYLPDSEIVRSFDRKIGLLQAQLATAKTRSNQGVTTQPNPTRTSLEGELSQQRAIAASAQQTIGVAQSQLDAKRAEMEQLPALQTKLAALARQQQVLERIQMSYLNRLETLKAAKVGRTNTSSLITPAQAGEKPVVPNTNLNISLGLLLGVAAGFLWSLSTESRRNPIRSLGQLNRLALQPCYRTIPELRIPMRGLSRPPAEAFEAMLVNFIRSEKKGYRMGIVGVNRNAGASTAAMNLAIAAARSGYKVLYVEADPGNTALTKLTPGVGDVKSPGELITIFNASLGETESAGPMGLPAELERMAADKDLVLFDFPPTTSSGDSFMLGGQMDEIVLLARANVTRSMDFLQAQQAFIDSGCPLVTVTLSRVVDQMDDIAALEQQAEIRPVPHQA